MRAMKRKQKKTKTTKSINEEAMLKKLDSKKLDSPIEKLHKLFLVLLVILGALLAFLIVGYIIFSAYLDYQDKQRFRANAGNVALVKEKFSPITQASNWNLLSSCTLPSVKFQTAIPSCGTSISQTFTLENRQEMKGKIDKFYIAIDQVKSLRTEDSKGYPDSNANLNLDRYDDGYADRLGGRSYKDIEAKMNCALNFALEKTQQAGESLRVGFRCSDKARETWFPRSDCNISEVNSKEDDCSLTEK